MTPTLPASRSRAPGGLHCGRRGPRGVRSTRRRAPSRRTWPRSARTRRQLRAVPARPHPPARPRAQAGCRRTGPPMVPVVRRLKPAGGTHRLLATTTGPRQPVAIVDHGVRVTLLLNSGQRGTDRASCMPWSRPDCKSSSNLARRAKWRPATIREPAELASGLQSACSEILHQASTIKSPFFFGELSVPGRNTQDCDRGVESADDERTSVARLSPRLTGSIPKSQIVRNGIPALNHGRRDEDRQPAKTRFPGYSLVGDRHIPQHPVSFSQPAVNLLDTGILARESA